MSLPASKADKLRQFINDCYDGKQKDLAEAFKLSPSLVSTWLSEKNEKSEVPFYMDQIMDLTREVQQLSSEIQRMRVGSIIKMKASYAIVHFPDTATHGAILCRGIPDLETADGLKSALHRDLKDTSKTNSKET